MPRPRKKFGGRPEGWERLAFDVPERLYQRFLETRDRMPTKSSKLLGTAAVGALLSMPPEVQAELYKWAHRNELDPAKADTSEAGAILLAVLATLKDLPLPPTEGKAVGGPKPGPKQNHKASGDIEVVYPPEQREGFTVQRIVTYSPAPTDRPEDKRADGERGKRDAEATG